MRTMIQRLLVAGAVACLAACDSDQGTMNPLTDEAQASVASTTKVYKQLERLANPLVSEVTVVKARHQLYNVGQPSTDVATFTGDVSGFVANVGGRGQAYGDAIAGALLPDLLLVYPKRDGKPVFWLSWAFGGYGGRSLSDDVVDIGLGAIFGNLLGNNSNVTPGLTTDNVPSNDVPFRSSFPYLAAAH